MSANSVALAYLVASVCLILALKGLASPETARRGNLLGVVGMVIAIATTFSLTPTWKVIVVGIVIGGAVGAILAKRIQMTQMPELVAAMHSEVDYSLDWKRRVPG